MEAVNRWKAFYISCGKIFFVCLLLLTTASCTTKLTYNYLDWIIPWYLSDYVSLNEQQKAILSRSLEKKLHWHRTVHLPQYIQVLNSIQLDLQLDLKKSLTYEQIERYYLIYNRLFREVVDTLAPDIALLLTTATEKQITELLENLRLQNENLRLNYILPAKETIIQQRAENTTQKLVQWTKYLTEEQKLAISTWSANLNSVNRHWMYYRLLWQQNFKIALNMRHQRTKFDKFIHQLFLYPEKYWSPDYTNAVSYNEKQTIRFYQTLISSLNTEQKQYLSEKIGTLLNDLQELAQNG